MLISDINVTTSDLTEILQMNYILRNQDLVKIANLIESDILNDSARLIPLLPLIWEEGPFNTITRVSINHKITEDKRNKRLAKIQDIKYPPLIKSGNLGYNRCSFKGQSIFYGGFGDIFALVENKPNKGDLITISEWKIKPDLKICYVPVFQSINIIESSPSFKNEWEAYSEQLLKLNNVNRTAIEVIYGLISYFFTRKVENNVEYIFSSYFANKFLNSSIQKIEAIFYPSVENNLLTQNIAILPEIFDLKFDFIQAREMLVLSCDKNKGRWISQELSIAKKADNDLLIWETKLDDSSITKLKAEFDFEL
jgi:hypothetical protein